MKRNATIAALWAAVFFAMMWALPDDSKPEELTAKQRKEVVSRWK